MKSYSIIKKHKDKMSFHNEYTYSLSFDNLLDELKSYLKGNGYRIEVVSYTSSNIRVKISRLKFSSFSLSYDIASCSYTIEFENSKLLNSPAHGPPYYIRDIHQGSIRREVYSLIEKIDSLTEPNRKLKLSERESPKPCNFRPNPIEKVKSDETYKFTAFITNKIVSASVSKLSGLIGCKVTDDIQNPRATIWYKIVCVTPNNKQFSVLYDPTNRNYLSLFNGRPSLDKMKILFNDDALLLDKAVEIFHNNTIEGDDAE